MTLRVNEITHWRPKATASGTRRDGIDGILIEKRGHYKIWPNVGNYERHQTLCPVTRQSLDNTRMT